MIRYWTMRFLHTADWQIGMSHASLGAAAEELRRARTAVARRIVALAREREVDFLLLAGDIFDANGVAPDEIARVLADAPAPVFVIAGNHDPLTAGSVWNRDLWAAQPRVRVIRGDERIELEGGVLLARSLAAAQGNDDPTEWMRGTPGTGIRIGMAHGTVEGAAAEDSSFPIPRDAAERAELDYLALGHFHSFALYGGRMAYAGAPEATGFGERDSGNVALVEIPYHGAMPKVEKVRVAAYEWKDVDLAIQGAEPLAALRRWAEAAEKPERTLVRLRLRGWAPASLLPAVAELKRVCERFLYAEIRDELKLQEGSAEWVEQLPEGYVRECGLTLAEEAAEDAVAAEALRVLGELWREVRA